MSGDREASAGLKVEAEKTLTPEGVSHRGVELRFS